MLTIKKLTTKYKELYKEYEEFLKRNDLEETDILQVQFIYSNEHLNKNCLTCKPELTREECSMYNLTIDDNTEQIIVDNEHGAIYVQLVKKTVIGFRCGNSCLKSKNDRLLNQWIIANNKSTNIHYQLLKTENFF
jgi:hypothetical protein